MPIFMDRHDVSEHVTAENVANLHQEDLKIQDQFGCRGLTYWFDEKRKTAFCLIEAPHKEAIFEMHNRAHGEVPHEVIEVDANIVESFLGRIEDPKKAKNTELNIISDPAFRTIMLIRLSVSLTQNRTLGLEIEADNYSDDILKLLSLHGGNTVKQSKSSFLVSFESVTNAVHASFEIESLINRASNLNKEKLVLKIGLSAGVPVTNKQSIFEDAIRLAKRMCRVIEQGIIISAEVQELYCSENSKGLSNGESVYCLTKDGEDFINLLIDFLEENSTNTNLRVEDFNKPMGLSKSNLYRTMISITGKPLNTFINDYRLEEALQLLNKKGKTVAEIAFNTGFSSPSYFSKCFQKRYGRLPSDYLTLQAN
jgi:AraC-like DNA-binding protein